MMQKTEVFSRRTPLAGKSALLLSNHVMKDPPNPRYTIVNLFPKTNSRALSLKISLQNRNKNKGRITTNTYFASHPPPHSRFPCCVLWYLSWNKRLSRVARFSTNQQHKSLKGCLWTKKNFLGRNLSAIFDPHEMKCVALCGNKKEQDLAKYDALEIEISQIESQMKSLKRVT